MSPYLFSKTQADLTTKGKVCLCQTVYTTTTGEMRHNFAAKETARSRLKPLVQPIPKTAKLPVPKPAHDSPQPI
jgi:hypothetical protein